MATGAPFQQGLPVPTAELNQKTITYTPDPTTEITMPGQIFYCTANSASYFKDDVTSRNIDDTGFNMISQNRHLHNADNNKAGGLLSEIYRANINNLLLFHKPLGFGPSDLMSYVGPTNAPTIALDLLTGATKLDTLGTNGNYIVSKLMGVSPSLKVPLTVKTVMQFVGNSTNVFARLGVNMEPMDLTNNNNAKFGIETCAASSSNWNIVSAEGGPTGTRTTMNGLAPLEGTNTVGVATSRRGHTIEHLPGSFVNYHYQTNAIVSKSTNLPAINSIPNTIPPDQAVVMGLKTTDTNAKQLYVWGMACIGGIDDIAWNQ